MLNIGFQIRQPNDPLQPVSLKNLGMRIRQPDQKFIDYLLQMRSVMALDVKKYREMKTRLPYIVAAHFHPPFRRIENFGSTQYLIVDFDHLADKEIDIAVLKTRIIADPRTALCFTSPSGDGLKVILKTDKAFFDPAKYSLFYKHFVSLYAQSFGAAQVVDKVTSDVSRACFVSWDQDAYLNENPQAVVIEDWASFENHSDLANLLSVPDAALTTETPKSPAQASRQELPAEILQRITQQLNPRLKEKQEKKIFVPQELDTALLLIGEGLAEFDMKIESVKNIHYGKQLKIVMQQWWGEVNVFYGKKGYSVVNSTKSGSSEKLTELAAKVIQSVLMP